MMSDDNNNLAYLLPLQRYLSSETVRHFIALS